MSSRFSDIDAFIIHLKKIDLSHLKNLDLSHRSFLSSLNACFTATFRSLLNCDKHCTKRDETFKQEIKKCVALIMEKHFVPFSGDIRNSTNDDYRNQIEAICYFLNVLSEKDYIQEAYSTADLNTNNQSSLLDDNTSPTQNLADYMKEEYTSDPYSFEPDSQVSFLDDKNTGSLGNYIKEEYEGVPCSAPMGDKQSPSRSDKNTNTVPELKYYIQGDSRLSASVSQKNEQYLLLTYREKKAIIRKIKKLVADFPMIMDATTIRELTSENLQQQGCNFVIEIETCLVTGKTFAEIPCHNDNKTMMDAPCAMDDATASSSTTLNSVSSVGELNSSSSLSSSVIHSKGNLSLCASDSPISPRRATGNEGKQDIEHVRQRRSFSL